MRTLGAHLGRLEADPLSLVGEVAGCDRYFEHIVPGLRIWQRCMQSLNIAPLPGELQRPQLSAVLSTKAGTRPENASSVSGETAQHRVPQRSDPRESGTPKSSQNHAKLKRLGEAQALDGQGLEVAKTHFAEVTLPTQPTAPTDLKISA